ncbi:MAG: amidohydrolase family protein [Victivallaceae bacterium]|nr:amidohydrolase family protein [Victivallaceae bacterium]
MKIDFHVHLYPEKVAEKAIAFTRTLGLAPDTDGTRNGLERSMDAAGIDFAVGMPIVMKPEHTASVNDYAAANNHGRIRMFGSVHPLDANYADTIRSVAERGLYGIKIHPEYQNIDIAAPEMEPIWKKCVEYRLPVLIHAGKDIAFKPPFHSDPARIAIVVGKHPGLKLIAAHFGGCLMWDEVERDLLGKPVWLDLSMAIEALPPERLTAMIRKHGVDRVLFASDSPWFSQKMAAEKFDRLPLSAEERAKICSVNALTLLGER